VEFIYALQQHLSTERSDSKREFIEASLERIAAAVDHSAEIRDDAPGEGGYPVASFTWIVVPAHIVDEQKPGAMTAFLLWMLGPGQRQAATLGYLALPTEIVAKEEEAIVRIQ
jgi:phosphate transport system substrate-binding protein